MLPNEVFLSHASQDSVFVAPLAETLRRQSVPVWYSQTNILGAQQWHDEIGSALSRCDWFALVLSPNSVASMWVKRELLFVLQQKRYENKIVPILYQPCDVSQLSWTLPAFQIVNFTSDLDEGYRALMRIWGLGYTPQQNTSP